MYYYHERLDGKMYRAEVEDGSVFLGLRSKINNGAEITAINWANKTYSTSTQKAVSFPEKVCRYEWMNWELYEKPCAQS